MLRKDLTDDDPARAVRHMPVPGNGFHTGLFHRGLLQTWRHGLCFALTAFVATFLDAANGKLAVSFFDVGQGDAILVSCPEGKHHLLIDSGDIRDLSVGVSEFVQRAVGRVSQKLSLAVSKPNLTGK